MARRPLIWNIESPARANDPFVELTLLTRPSLEAVMLRISLRARVPVRATVSSSTRRCTREKMTTELLLFEPPLPVVAHTTTPATTTTAATAAAMIFWLRDTLNPPTLR